MKDKRVVGDQVIRDGVKRSKNTSQVLHSDRQVGCGGWSTKEVHTRVVDSLNAPRTSSLEGRQETDVAEIGIGCKYEEIMYGKNR